MVAVVELHGWIDWPVHCPFCGGTSEEFKECKHMLYLIVEGNFSFRSERFSIDAGIVDAKGDGPLLSWQELQTRGDAEQIALKVDLPNHIQFRLETSNDVINVGFACLEEELSGWEKTPVDPHN